MSKKLSRGSLHALMASNNENNHECINCNHTNQPGTKFCESCGSKLELSTTENCFKCGKSNQFNYKFCEFCGAPKNSGTELTAASSKSFNEASRDQKKTTDKPAGNNQPVSSGQKKSGFPWIFIFIGVAVAGAAVFFMLSKSEKKVDPPKAISSPPKANNVSQGALEATEVLPEVYFQQAKPYILGMIAAIKSKNEKVLVEQIQNINALRKPNSGDRKNARHFNEAGLAALKQNNLEFAIANFNQAVEEDPTDQEATNNLGYAYYLKNDFVNARALLEYTIALAPQRTSAWANYGEVLFKQGMTDTGINAYQIAYLYAKNQDRLVQYIEKQSKENEDTGLRNFYSQVLSAISKMK